MMPPCDEPGSIHDCIHRIGVGVDRSTSDWFFAGTQRARQHHASMSWCTSKRIEQLAPELASVSAHRVLRGMPGGGGGRGPAGSPHSPCRIEADTAIAHSHARNQPKGEGGAHQKGVPQGKTTASRPGPPAGFCENMKACLRRPSLRPEFPLWIPGLKYAEGEESRGVGRRVDWRIWPGKHEHGTSPWRRCFSWRLNRAASPRILLRPVALFDCGDAED